MKKIAEVGICEVGDADNFANSAVNSLRSDAVCFVRQCDGRRAVNVTGTGTDSMRSLRRPRSNRWRRTADSCDGGWRLLAREVGAPPAN
jgi:hypothetical protein